MVDVIGNNTVVSNVNAPAKQNSQQNVYFRGKSDFERTPDVDSFDGTKKAKKKTGRKLLKWLGLAAATLGVVCFIKGKGPEGTKKGIMQRLKDGWQALFSKAPINKDGIPPVATSPAERETIWKAKTDSVVKEFEKALDGRISVKTGPTTAAAGVASGAESAEEVAKLFMDAGRM